MRGNPAGYLTHKSTKQKTSKQKGTAALITLYTYYKKAAMICSCYHTRERYTKHLKIKAYLDKEGIGVRVPFEVYRLVLLFPK